MKSVEHSMTFVVPQPVSGIFPLFSPEGENHWVPGWDYENAMDTNSWNPFILTHVRLGKCRTKA